MIEAQNLTKDYGTVLAVSDVTFRVGRGEVVGFLGPNGAGKTTTLRMLAGFLGPTSGRVTIDGVDMQRSPREAKRRLGYMPEAAPLYPEMRVSEYLEFRAALKGVPRSRRREALKTALDRAAIADVAETIVQHLSKGYRQRLGLADALVASPPLLILDEPTAGLDPNQIRDVRQLIRELGKNHTILLSTHILSEVEATCDRAIVIDRGRLVAEGTLGELRARGRAQRVVAVVRDPAGKSGACARALPGVTGVELAPEGDAELVRLTLEIEGDAGALAEALVRALTRESIGVRSLATGKASLEEVFAALTRSPAPKPGAETGSPDAGAEPQA
jgi:ABC-2 type transport system ATP-binding protein